MRMGHLIQMLILSTHLIRISLTVEHSHTTARKAHLNGARLHPLPMVILNTLLNMARLSTLRMATGHPQTINKASSRELLNMDRSATILGVTEPLSLGHTVLLLNTDHLKIYLTVQIPLSNMVIANQVHTQMFLNSMEIVNRVHIQMPHKETFLIPMARFLNN